MSIKLALYFTVIHRTVSRGKFSSQTPPPPRHHTPHIPNHLAHHEKHPIEEPQIRPILVRSRSCIASDCCRESYPLFRVLRHRTPSSPICLSGVIHKPFALSRVFLLSSGGKSVLLVKKKAPSRSGILLSMHVVLKTRHVNPNIHVRRY